MALDKRLKTLTKLDSNLRFDLGGLAKGYAADQILATLKAFGITQAMIELGGDIRCGDAPHDKAGWNIGLRSPLPTITDSIVVSNCAISTSGDRFQAIEINGQRYSHILDPATGLGQTQPILATVVAPTALQSDPMSTAACIDPKYFAALSSATDIHSYIWIRNGLQVSPGFPERSTLSTPLEPAKSQ